MAMAVPEDYPYADPPRLPEGDVALGDLLPGDGPLEIEIGPGRGAFIIGRCTAESHVRMVGLEIRRKWASVVDEKLAQLGMSKRARVFCEDARLALPRLLPDQSVSNVFIHFPDPWWKKRHQKRLVVVDPLLDEVARLLKDGGMLLVQTDVEDRALEYDKRLAQHPALAPAGDNGSVLEHNPYSGRSNRETRCEKDGLPIHRLRYTRKRRTS